MSSAKGGKVKDQRPFRDGTKPRSFKEDKKLTEPKKGGGGGKGTWGKPGSEINPAHYFIDKRDPNYPEEEGETVFANFEPELTSEEIKKLITPIILEYFEIGDTDEVKDSVNRFSIRQKRPEILVLWVNLSLERTDVKREMISVLLSESYDVVLKGEEIYDGFNSLLSSLDDLTIDVPDAPQILGKFIARAVADKILHHSFLENNVLKSKQVEEALNTAQVLISSNSGVELDTVWGIGGGLRPVRILSEKMDLLIQEYFNSSDKPEAERCLRTLAVPHFHHELVYMLLVDTAEKKQHEFGLALELLKYFHASAVLTLQQLQQGFERLFSDANDIAIDIPSFHTFLDSFVKQAVEAGVLSQAMANEVPTKGRKRYLSENDGGAIKN